MRKSVHERYMDNLVKDLVDVVFDTSREHLCEYCQRRERCEYSGKDLEAFRFCPLENNIEKLLHNFDMEKLMTDWKAGKLDEIDS